MKDWFFAVRNDNISITLFGGYICRVKQFLAKYPDLQSRLFDASTHTADLAAQALGVTPGQIAKTLVFLADGKHLLVVACGDRRVDTKKLVKSLVLKN